MLRSSLIEILFNLDKKNPSTVFDYNNTFNPEINFISFDSREVCPGTAFFAVPGCKYDGINFIPEAVEKGSVLVVFQEDSELSQELWNIIKKSDSSCIFLGVKDVRLALAKSASEFFENPSRDMLLVGITGTNGKTSTAWILSQLLNISFDPAIYLGTLGLYQMSGNGPDEISGEGRTTLDSVSINKILYEANISASKAAALEVTSHALDQCRTSFIDWNIAAFTNITQDHLDYHKNMSNYKEAKAKLFLCELSSSSKNHKCAVINIDDDFGIELVNRILNNNSDILILKVSEKNPEADLYLSSVSTSNDCTDFELIYNQLKFSGSTNLLGGFNITNMLLAIGCAIKMNIPLGEILKRTPYLKQVPGRLELVANKPVKIFVDYAHTPDALDKVQNSLRKFMHNAISKKCNKNEEFIESSPRLICVFGCGGDRDRTKRPLMAASVERYSDYAIVTSDNPRTEDPDQIIEDVIKGFSDKLIQGNKQFFFETIPDRRTAIRRAISIAHSNDVVLIAGKGHESYQEIMGIKNPFDDRKVALEELLILNTP
ncbi:MAG TPA: UDP-N-acetylmuramoyl-L-alanyl-D-glutamate--2,6-diaminopimelate ligase [Oligoflexia bacterium]|nr:UDP-N-acetylmuramoyl-L-alanyl-D-glutamate--2,6-diaminopimelate ligase [Oligoflexia bacterium]HMP48674.1 UDP-N-acetylmuramoyl-L-alanyl-D-glutamate--2,6-diaminopimelate ligase [Oligoflexia bacterium]